MQHQNQHAGLAYPISQHPVPSTPAPAYFAYLPSPSRWTFTQGLIVGQISMVIIALLLIRYVIFEDSATALEKERMMRLKISERRSKRHAKALLQDARRATTASAPPCTSNPLRKSTRVSSDTRAFTFANILDKTAYDISSHLAESTDWLNVMFAQAIAGYREDVLTGGVSPPPPPPSSSSHSHHAPHSSPGIHLASDTIEIPADLEPGKERTARDLMEEILNRASSSFLDPIRVTEADFGDAYPIFTNARVRPADDTGRTRIEIDVDYSDQITLAIDTKLLVNFPKPRFAVLPVSLSLTIVRFSGTVAIELFSSDPNASVLPTTSSAPASGTKASQAVPPRSRHQLHFSLHPDFALEASATSLLGSRAKLQDIPKIEQLLISRLRGWIMDRFVWPRYWSLTLPNLVPSPTAARGSGNDALANTATTANGDSASVSEDQMKLSTGIERPDDSVIQPGHLKSTRQEMAVAAAASSSSSANVPTRPMHSLSSSSVRGSASGLGMPAGIGSVEAWRAHTAGAYGQQQQQQHATSLTRAALLRANSGMGGGGATDSAPGSDVHIEVPGSFKGSVAGTGIRVGSSAMSNGGGHTASGLRNRGGFN
ncbi:related to MMM1 - required for mitochondrial shape and structure [Melanopsichium pennsylvanicum]|uniref:Maintenance of mitochondrial morphology protein 1 n=2 Tax=Melanopsichium pennsylvanicum TaxID=63383 RepID=A0AAJ4XQQ5_9BASI|nr:related to MMM1-required for mitochondrial shape and structure [Melanopsichium pennsylvanicum 4]SNX85358.1 related to MMM1 - required for mitochondrial shape and structure [Melanopsichium pennsylvanicum]